MVTINAGNEWLNISRKHQFAHTVKSHTDRSFHLLPPTQLLNITKLTFSHIIKSMTTLNNIKTDMSTVWQSLASFNECKWWLIYTFSPWGCSFNKPVLNSSQRNCCWYQISDTSVHAELQHTHWRRLFGSCGARQICQFTRASRVSAC